MTDYFDVLVVGAGPTGLLLTRELSQRLSVLLIEKGVLLQTSKYWITTRARLEQRHLLNSIAYSANRVTVGTFLGDSAATEGDFVALDERKLLLTLVDQCRSFGAIIKDRAELLSFSWPSQSSVVAHTSIGDFKTRLLVDASGGLSSLAGTFQLHRIQGFFSVYGAKVTGIDLKSGDIAGAHIIRMGRPAPIFEVIPLGRHSAFCALFVASKRLVSPDNLTAEFHRHMTINPFFLMTDKTSFEDEKMGAIPIGKVRRRALPGILSWGEAGMVQSPLLGAALNEVLEYLPQMTAMVLDAFSQGGQNPVRVRLRPSPTKRFNDLVQSLMFRAIADGGVEPFSRLVRYIENLGPERSFKLYSGRLNILDLPQLILALRKIQSRLPT